MCTPLLFQDNCLIPTWKTACHTHLLCLLRQKKKGGGSCRLFLWDRQVASRKPGVNPRLSQPGADWSQTGMCLTDFLRDPLSPSGMLLSFGTLFFHNLYLTRLTQLKPVIIVKICALLRCLSLGVMLLNCWFVRLLWPCVSTDPAALVLSSVLMGHGDHF